MQNVALSTPAHSSYTEIHTCKHTHCAVDVDVGVNAGNATWASEQQRQHKLVSAKGQKRKKNEDEKKSKNTKSSLEIRSRYSLLDVACVRYVAACGNAVHFLPLLLVFSLSCMLLFHFKYLSCFYMLGQVSIRYIYELIASDTDVGQL